MSEYCETFVLSLNVCILINNLRARWYHKTVVYQVMNIAKQHFCKHSCAYVYEGEHIYIVSK